MPAAGPFPNTFQNWRTVIVTDEQRQTLIGRQEQIRRAALEASGFDEFVRELAECSDTVWELLSEAVEKLPSLLDPRRAAEDIFTDVIGTLETKAMKDAGTYDEWCDLADQYHEVGKYTPA
jgi:hypothetical protein